MSTAIAKNQMSRQGAKGSGALFSQVLRQANEGMDQFFRQNVRLSTATGEISLTKVIATKAG